MNETQAREAARLVWDHWHAGTTVGMLPEHCRPRTRAEGYAAQAQLTTVSGRRQIGWKIAATSTAGQKHINVSGPLAGRMFEGETFAPGATVPSRGNQMRVAEPEMAFVFGRALLPRGTPYSVDEVLAAVATLHPAIEIPDTRMVPFTEAGEAQLLADNACTRHFMLGAAAPESWRALDLSRHAVHARVTRRDGTVWTRDGSGAAVLGDPRVALAWLVNEVNGLGITAEAGHFVTTGTCMVPLELLPGDAVVVDYGVLGTLGMRFGD